MFNKKSIKRYFRQIKAIAEKNIFLELRVKTELITRFLNPLVQLLVLIFIFGLIFNMNSSLNIGYWNANNYTLFLIIAFCIQFSKPVTQRYVYLFSMEKYWKTLSATLVAPVNKLTLLTGILLSEFILISIPIMFLFILALILYPINLLFFLLVLVVFFSIYLTLSSIGLIISAFGISNEKYVPIMYMCLLIIFIFSCANYPKEIFPEFIQFFIVLNPFYYLFDLLRLVWYLGIDFNVAIKLITYVHIIIVLLFTSLTPIISIKLFNSVFKKHGIAGY